MGNGNENMEKMLHIRSVPVLKMNDITNCICSIFKLDRFNRGFFCKIPFPDTLHNLPVIIIINQNLTEEDLMPGKNISLTFKKIQKIFILIPIEKLFLVRNIIFQLLK